MADQVWDWCETAHTFGRTVTVKIKYGDFWQASRSRTLSTRVLLHETRLDLIRSIYPPAKGIRLLGVTVSVFEAEDVADLAQLGLQLGAIV